MSDSILRVSFERKLSFKIDISDARRKAWVLQGQDPLKTQILSQYFYFSRVIMTYVCSNFSLQNHQIGALIFLE
jgi:hypothetical protein